VVLSKVLGGVHADINLYMWIPVGKFRIPVGFLIDELSAVMMATVSFVAA